MKISRKKETELSGVLPGDCFYCPEDPKTIYIKTVKSVFIPIQKINNSSFDDEAIFAKSFPDSKNDVEFHFCVSLEDGEYQYLQNTCKVVPIKAEVICEKL